MQVSVESTGNLERRMTFRLPAERIDTQVGGRLQEMARTARIKGFRPGKVPAKVIEQRYGQQVRAEVLDGLLRESFDSAVRDNALRLAGNPRIEPGADSGEGELTYVASDTAYPRDRSSGVPPATGIGGFSALLPRRSCRPGQDLSTCLLVAGQRSGVARHARGNGRRGGPTRDRP